MNTSAARPMPRAWSSCRSRASYAGAHRRTHRPLPPPDSANREDAGLQPQSQHRATSDCHGKRGGLSAIAIVAASEITVKAFLRNHIAALAQRYPVCVIVNTSDTRFLDKLEIAGELIAAPIARPIAPVADLRAMAQLTRLFRQRHFDLVHSVTPKAGLIATLAGRMAGVPRRLHTFTGQVWATRRRPMRSLLKSADRLIANSATHVLVDSFSQRDFLVAQGIVDAGKASVLGRGSISGVDANRFRPDPDRKSTRLNS